MISLKHKKNKQHIINQNIVSNLKYKANYICNLILWIFIPNTNTINERGKGLHSNVKEAKTTI